MIFNESGNGISSAYYEGSNEVSKYDLGIGGALMHIYENELNYNAMMKSVGLSELKYMAENGGELFVNESGAFSSFIDKAKAFFKKVIDKIVAIFNKFMTVINGFIMKDKAFVKKYELEIKRKNISDLEFNGYEKLLKDDLLSDFATSNFDVESLQSYIDIKKFTDSKSIDSMRAQTGSSDIRKAAYNANYAEKISADELSDIKDSLRGDIIKTLGGNAGSFNESEFLDELKDIFYGDKETFDVKDSYKTAALNIIENSSKIISNINKTKTKIVKYINDIIKKLESFGKTKADEDAMDKDIKYGSDKKRIKNGYKKGGSKSNFYSNVGSNIDILRTYSNTLTALAGFMVTVAKTANRQARAICVKIIMYKPKNESAIYTNESYNDGDLFSGVNLI